VSPEDASRDASAVLAGIDQPAIGAEDIDKKMSNTHAALPAELRVPFSGNTWYIRDGLPFADRDCRASPHSRVVVFDSEVS
jgi:hypothetical protein